MIKYKFFFVFCCLTLSFKSISTPYIPIFKKGVYITKHGMQCIFEKNHDLDFGTIDLCGGEASVDVRFDIAQMRSIFNNANGESTENKKYVSFIVGENSGAGIHISNQVTQEHTRFASWTERDDFIGGFSREYGIKIEPISGYVPSIYRHFPLNENKNYQHRDTKGFTIGVNGSLKADIGAQGPKLAPEISGSYSYTNNKTIVYDTSDYKIVNSTNQSTFQVNYIYDVNLCNSSFAGNGLYDCSWKDFLWGKSFVHDKSKINPLAYANFHPKMELIYEAPVEETGKTIFQITVSAAPEIIYGAVRYDGLHQRAYSSQVYTQHYLISANIVIDWGHPLFEPEAHVYLQSLEDNDKCLSVSQRKITLSACNGNWEQTWGLDSYQRYKSRSGHNLCLAVNDDKSITVEQCTFAMNQKWYWQEEYLISRLVGANDHQYALNLFQGQLSVAPIKDDEHTSRFMPALANIN